MNAIPLEHGLALAAVLFSLGLIGLMVRRNILFVLMSLEVMMNATPSPLSSPAAAGCSLTAR